MRVNGLVPARFLTIIAHMVIVIVILWSREENVIQCLPLNYTADEYNTKDTEMIIGLSVTLGLFVIELIGFIGGISMFMPFQSLLSTAAHASGAVALAFFLFQLWSCDYYWYVFAFCVALPAVGEIMTMIGVAFFRKGL
ncbi:transmembrane protein 107-like isoform X2 [Mizuhopecten yessoensis]|uniref:Transmembrane protein 107 n=1 Tax=Mizuhopecten yessoensis TaxID=6573 RepID=A0A210QY37_MIZYE|nr:transmembrane protein 107-like isoform X2 [Mizuhopecten yessoensis]OWF53653.1 Transmembrane protein 107 [Mizuhopecten yessoensis]